MIVECCVGWRMVSYMPWRGGVVGEEGTEMVTWWKWLAKNWPSSPGRSTLERILSAMKAKVWVTRSAAVPVSWSQFRNV